MILNQARVYNVTNYWKALNDLESFKTEKLCLNSHKMNAIFLTFSLIKKIELSNFYHFKGFSQGYDFATMKENTQFYRCVQRFLSVHVECAFTIFLLTPPTANDRFPNLHHTLETIKGSSNSAKNVGVLQSYYLRQLSWCKPTLIYPYVRVQR